METPEVDLIRVVIVDDQAPFREAARMVVDLTEPFQTVGEAATGEESLDLVRELDPDLVLMDMNLPGIDGLEATRRILAASERTRVVFVLSTYEPDEYARRAVEAGASAYIPKSVFGPDALAEAWADATSGAAPTA